MADSEKPGILRNLRVKRVSLVEAGANFDTKTGDGAHIMLFKAAGPTLGDVHTDTPECKCYKCADVDPYEKSDDVGKGKLDTKARHALPDSAFAAVWTDAKGRHRKLPIHDAGHLAAARGRVDGADIPDSVKAEARHKIDAATHKESGVTKTKKTFKDVVKSLVAAFAETDAEKREKLIKAAEGEAAEMDAPPAAAAADGGHDAMKMAHAHLGKAIAAFGAGPHAPDHPVHAMKAQHAALGATLKAAGVATDEPGGLADGDGVHKEGVVEGNDSAGVAKRFTDLEKSNSELVAQLVIEKGIRLDREMSDILKSFKATPFKLEGEDSDVTRFRKMKELDPAGFERTMTILKATDAQLAASMVYKNVGTSRTGTGSAYDQLKAKADSIIEKSATPLSFEKAFERVSLENPKLVEQYRNEQQ